MSNKKLVILWVLLLTLTAIAGGAILSENLSAEVVTDDDWAKIFEIICKAESNADKEAVGDKDLLNKAYGTAQIRRDYLIDARVWASENPNDENALAFRAWDKAYGGLTPEKLKGTHTTVSYTIFRCYMSRWAIPEKIGHIPTREDVVRIHNGGGPRYGKQGWYRDTNRAVALAGLASVSD